MAFRPHKLYLALWHHGCFPKLAPFSISAIPRSKVLKIASAKTTLPASFSVPSPERTNGPPTSSNGAALPNSIPAPPNSSPDNAQPSLLTKNSASDASEEEKTDYVIPRPFFDTYALIKGLQNRNFTKEQAEALQSTFQAILNRRFDELEKNFVTQIQIENDASLLKSKCQEIRLDLQILSNRQHLDMKSWNEKAINDIQLLTEKLKDTTDVLTLDSNMRIHFYKGENQDEIQKIDSFIYKLNGIIRVLVSDIKTASESSRWKAFYSLILGVSITFFALSFIRFYFVGSKKKKSLEKAYEDDSPFQP